MNSGVYMNLFDIDPEKGWEHFEQLFDEENNIVRVRRGGITASVFVADQPAYDNRYLSVNGKIEASTNADLETQLMCAHLPLLLHEDPRDVMVIGLASGITVGAAAAHPVETIRVVEIEKAMVPAARLFAEYNDYVLDDPRVELSINDARNELEFSAQTYDVIISEPSNPWMTVASNLFTEDFFRMARTRVRPGGVFSQWIQNYYLPAEDLRSIVAAFRASFRYVMLFETYDGVDLLLMGSQEPLEPGSRRRWERNERVARAHGPGTRLRCATPWTCCCSSGWDRRRWIACRGRAAKHGRQRPGGVLGAKNARGVHAGRQYRDAPAFYRRSPGPAGTPRHRPRGTGPATACAWRKGGCSGEISTWRWRPPAGSRRRSTCRGRAELLEKIEEQQSGL